MEDGVRDPEDRCVSARDVAVSVSALENLTVAELRHRTTRSAEKTVAVGNLRGLALKRGVTLKRSVALKGGVTLEGDLALKRSVTLKRGLAL